jgi:hypothetical protein
MGFEETEQVAPFHFYEDINDYTGISAASYEDFLTSIKQVKTKSLSFHVKRGDFEKWVSDVLKDEKLAKKIRRIKNLKLQGQTLRNRLHRVISKRHIELHRNTHRSKTVTDRSRQKTARKVRKRNPKDNKKKTGKRKTKKVTRTTRKRKRQKN